jgi:hypothetical protein
LACCFMNAGCLLTQAMSMRRPWGRWLAAMVGAAVLPGCGPKAVEEPVEVEVEEATAELIPAPPELVEDAPEVQEVVFEAVTDDLTPETIGGIYRDPKLPEVTFELGRGDNVWRAVWQPDDPSRGLLMEGFYAVEGDAVHLRCMTFGRREALFDDDWERRTPAHPRPRAFFQIRGNALVLVPGRTDQAFTMAPFNATRLLKVQ